MPEAIGLLELSSIAMGYEVEDAVLKAADVRLLVARTICSGKYLVVVGGTVAAVNSSVEAGVNLAEEGLIDQIVIPNVHPSVFPAITGVVDLSPDAMSALGIIETFSASSAVESADTAVKAGSVTLFRIHLAMAVGGKGFVLMTGDVAGCRAAVEAGAAAASAHWLLVNKVVMPRPRLELFGEYI
ncbi:MAG: BMC domain-containing protein [Candidatus Sumerlaeota bacterium]|nr:BMC domain-containing protein [Candidatus Sumerlaeota bacterium]